jgi:hypothetical protein
MKLGVGYYSEEVAALYGSSFYYGFDGHEVLVTYIFDTHEQATEYGYKREQFAGLTIGYGRPAQRGRCQPTDAEMLKDLKQQIKQVLHNAD